MAIWSRLTSGIAGFGVGAATADTVEPVLEPLKQTAWRNNPAKALGAREAAHAATRGLDTAVDFPDDAAREGVGPARYAVLRDLAVTYPGLAELDKLSNRQIIADPEVIKKALHRHGYDDTFTNALIKLFSDLLSVSENAAAVQQGHLPNPGVLPEPSASVTPATAVKADPPDGQPPTSVPLTQIDLDPIQEAAGQGYDLPRFKVLANLAGLPPGPQELLTMWNRQLVDEESVDAGLREGHLKTKWSGAFKRLRWNVLSHIQYVDARVRGWIDNAAMYEGGALHGFTPAQMDILHKTHGRPLSFHQTFIGLQRGGKRLDPVADDFAAGLDIDPTFLAAMQQSDVQQQWYSLAWAQRYNYPSAFVLKAMAKAGDIDEQTLRDVLKFIGWEPTFIDKVAKAWAPTVTAGTKKQTLTHLTDEYLAGALTRDALVTVLTTSLGFTAAQANDEITLAEFNAAKAERTRAARALEKRFVAAQLPESEARNALAQLGFPEAAVSQKIIAWLQERAATLTTLSVGQIEKALKAGALTAAQATPLLQQLGEDAQAIQTILASNAEKLSVAQIEGQLKAGTLSPADATLELQMLGLPATAIADILAAFPPGS